MPIIAAAGAINAARRGQEVRQKALTLRQSLAVNSSQMYCRVSNLVDGGTASCRSSHVHAPRAASASFASGMRTATAASRGRSSGGRCRCSVSRPLATRWTTSSTQWIRTARARLSTSSSKICWSRRPTARSSRRAHCSHGTRTQRTSPRAAASASAAAACAPQVSSASTAKRPAHAHAHAPRPLPPIHCLLRGLLTTVGESRSASALRVCCVGARSRPLAPTRVAGRVIDFLNTVTLQTVLYFMFVASFQLLTESLRSAPMRPRTRALDHWYAGAPIFRRREPRLPALNDGRPQ